MLGESKTYLCNALFDNPDTLVKKYCKEIFEIELDGICTDEKEWPKKRNFSVFKEWFNYEVSDYVIDLSSKAIFNHQL
jgi:hypothetical protein